MVMDSHDSSYPSLRISHGDNVLPSKFVSYRSGLEAAAPIETLFDSLLASAINTGSDQSVVNSSSNRDNQQQNQDTLPSTSSSSLEIEEDLGSPESSSEDYHSGLSNSDHKDHDHGTGFDSDGKSSSSTSGIDYPPLKRHAKTRNDDRRIFELMKIQPTGVGAGLLNLGNTCFINSILQCFTHTVPLIQRLGSYNHQTPCNCGNEGFCVLRCLRDHIEHALRSSGDAISPSVFFKNLNYFSSDFTQYDQEDAHEFLQSFLDKLERCKGTKKGYPESLDSSIVEHVFGSRLISQAIATTLQFSYNCGHSSNTSEPSDGFSLEIEDVNDLQSGLKSFTRLEKLEDEFECDNCKLRVFKEKQLMLDQAPVIATFHLKRFKNDGFSIKKIAKHVKFPLELNLQPFTVSSESTETGLNYRLYAIVEHTGESLTYGHYITYIRSSPSTWHKLDDETVSSVQEKDVLSENAYILLYAKEDTPWFSSVADLELRYIQQDQDLQTKDSTQKNREGKLCPEKEKYD